MSKLKQVLKGIFVFIIFPILLIFTWYKIEITPEVNKINSLISFNENHIKKLKEKDQEKFLFNDNYTDEQFNKDYKLFSDIYNGIYDKKQEDKLKEKYPEILWRSVLTKYYSIIYLNKVYPEFTYEQLLDYKLFNESKALLVKDKNKREALLLNNYNLVRTKFKYTDFIVIESVNSILFMDRYYYDEMIKIFNDKYGDDSIIKALMVKSINVITRLKNERNPSSNLDKQIKEDSEREAFIIKERDIVNLKIGKAFLNNDKDKMKLYVKQMREYLDFLNGFDLPFYKELGTISSYGSKKKAIALQVVLFKNGSAKDMKKENMEKFLHTITLSRYPY